MAHDTDDTETELREQLSEQLATLESVNLALAEGSDAELCDVPPSSEMSFLGTCMQV